MKEKCNKCQKCRCQDEHPTYWRDKYEQEIVQEYEENKEEFLKWKEGRDDQSTNSPLH